MDIIIKQIAQTLREYADNLESGNSNISADEGLEMISNIACINLNKQQVADRYKTSTKTIERREKEGLIPPSHPVQVSKKQWNLNELLAYERENLIEEN